MHGESGLAAIPLKLEWVMRRMELTAFMRAVEERKQVLGITEAMIAEARNDGARRTPDKHALLRHMRDRALKAGTNPCPRSSDSLPSRHRFGLDLHHEARVRETRHE